MQLIYFADPMCSWCWGFAPVISALQDAFGDELPIRLVMGGLRPGATEPMSADARETLRGHWSHVTEASGQPFGKGALSSEGFVYDTDPAARAVVLVRRSQPALALGFLHLLQRAFYVDGADVTDVSVLSGLAGAVGFDPKAFEAAMHSETAKQETWRDYAVAHRAGVTGFPTLVIGPRPDGAYEPVTRGFAPMGTVLPAVARLVEGLAAASAGARPSVTPVSGAQGASGAG